MTNKKETQVTQHRDLRLFFICRKKSVRKNRKRKQILSPDYYGGAVLKSALSLHYENFSFQLKNSAVYVIIKNGYL